MHNNQEYLDKLRHSTAHLLASAVLELYPDAKPTIGPAIEDGFYYDFDFSHPITEEDLPKIEQKMREILPTWTEFTRKEVSTEEARKIFKNNPYKLELIDELEKKDQPVTTYTSGKFEDLCRGGHVEKPNEEIKAFKLLSIAGAYWRGSEKNKMLTRIYGTAFPSQKQLDEHLQMLEEAKKRDHRKLGQDLDLFTISDEIGPGLILWLPKGTIIKEELEKFGKETENKEGYQRVSTPHIAKESLFYLSGHLPYYAGDMFPPMQSEEGNYYLKPMNCPHMYMIYKARQHSYKEFPVRYAEFGTVYRYEDSGALLGLMRVRGLTQNDAHIFCADEEQALEELIKVMKLHTYYYEIFGIKDYYVELALPDFKTKADKYINDPESWEKSVNILRKAARKSGVEVAEKEGEAAFYGPKFDFNIKSIIGREFSASTNQLDFGAGHRFNLTFSNKEGNEEVVPYIIHRAPLGSDERFIGFLIEHYGGAFPTWLSPVQVMVIPITDRNINYGQKVLEQLNNSNIRTGIDARGEKMQAKVRDAQLQKIPYMIILGDREEKSKTISLRTRTGAILQDLLLEEFIGKVTQEISERKNTLFIE